jgi:AmiR/NasT family two-component response regulator
MPPFVTSVLLIQPAHAPHASMADDFAAAGFTVQGPVPCAELVRHALRASPDVVACWQPKAEPEFIEALRTLQAQQSAPLAVFTQDTDAEWMQAGLDAGANAWVVQGYAPQRLRALVQLAQARFARERKLLADLADVESRLAERKLVDKAKGVLMRSRNVSEDEAFQMLRSASMHGNQRMGQVSRQVIDAAMVAEAINRSGQQRMLSQRLVKLYALACCGTEAAAAALVMKQSVARVEENLASLDKALSTPTFGDLLAGAHKAWKPIARLLAEPPKTERLFELDRLADAMLAQSDSLVAALEGSGLANTVAVINTAGRQRMLSQRLAKLALMAPKAAGEGEAVAPLREAMAQATQAFEAGLAQLEAAPLTSTEIRDTLAQARKAWTELLEGAEQGGQAPGRMRIASASEALLDVSDRLTEAYQNSLHVLMG